MVVSQFEDDLSVLDDADLWRGIHRNRLGLDFCVYIEKQKRYRPTSLAFQYGSKDNAISVLLADIVIASGRTANDVLDAYAGLASLTAGQVRSMNHGVSREPTVAEEAHAQVFSKSSPVSVSHSKKIQRQMAKTSKWVIPPPECH